MGSKSTIVIRKTTRQLLKQIGKKDQTYDELIKDLIKSKENDRDPLDRRFVSPQSSEPRTA
jgi:hypothetical protein